MPAHIGREPEAIKPERDQLGRAPRVTRRLKSLRTPVNATGLAIETGGTLTGGAGGATTASVMVDIR
jgi:hypothetical protein